MEENWASLSISIFALMNFFMDKTNQKVRPINLLLLGDFYLYLLMLETNGLKSSFRSGFYFPASSAKSHSTGTLGRKQTFKHNLRPEKSFMDVFCIMAFVKMAPFIS